VVLFDVEKFSLERQKKKWLPPAVKRQLFLELLTQELSNRESTEIW